MGLTKKHLELLGFTEYKKRWTISIGYKTIEINSNLLKTWNTKDVIDWIFNTGFNMGIEEGKAIKIDEIKNALKLND